MQSKYPSISGISGMHDILLSKKSGKVLATYRKVCFNGDYAVLRNYKYNPKHSLSDLSPYNSVPLSSENWVNSTGDTLSKMYQIMNFLPF